MSPELQRTCPSCGTPALDDPYDVGSGAEFCCPVCDWCWGAHGQALDPNDSFRLPEAVVNELPEWARPVFSS